MAPPASGAAVLLVLVDFDGELAIEHAAVERRRSEWSSECDALWQREQGRSWWGAVGMT